MRIMIDACVLYPTVMREMVMGVAAAGAFEPQWSQRLLDEWAHAAGRLGPEGAAQAQSEIAVLTAGWPQACVQVPPEKLVRFWLPDANDIHVLAAAVEGHSDAIMTLNAKDFPRGILAEEGLSRVDPDGYLIQLCAAQPDLCADVAADVLATARRLSGQDWSMRALMKKARLPRLGKMLADVAPRA